MSPLMDLSADLLKESSTSNVKIQFVRCLVLCFINVTLVIFGGIIFQSIEGVKRVHRDFIDSLWNETSSMNEIDWKSSARHKLMAFENELHEAVEAGVYSYSGQKSWTISNSILYTFSVISTIGFGPLSCSTRLCRLVTCLFVISGVPTFCLLITELARLFLAIFKSYTKTDYSSYIDQMFVVMVGTLSGIFSIICFINPLDSIYMVFGILSTNGFTDLLPQEMYIMLLLSGLIVISITLVRIFLATVQMRLQEILNGLLKKYNIYHIDDKGIKLENKNGSKAH